MDPHRYERYVPPLTGPPPVRRSESWPWHGGSVHLLRVGDPTAPVRLLVLHGAGGNSDALWPFVRHLAGPEVEITVPDLPLYGRTTVPRPGGVRHEHWRELLVDLVEREHDERPLVVLGASLGGMLAYDVAAATGRVAHVVATCLLDPRVPEVRERMAWHPLLGRAAGQLLPLVRGPLAEVMVPVRWVADMRNISNDPGLVREVIHDGRGGGGRVPLGWMRSFMESAPVVEPEEFTGAPVTVVHPGDDRWTPGSLTEPFLRRIAAPTAWVDLEGAGHFPVEEPGFTQLVEAVGEVVARTRAG